MANKNKFLITFLLTIILSNSFSQGCSDAGLCSLPGNQTNDTILKNWKSTFSFAPTYSLGEHFTSIISSVADFRLSYKNAFFSFRIPYHFIFGDVGNTNGIGDLSLIFGTNFKLKEKHLTANIGIKFPSGKTNIKHQNNSLPMVYQTGLGTTDFIAGLSFSDKKWYLAFATQIPISNHNKNEYLSDYHPINSSLFDFYNSKNLIRSGDLMLRIDKLYPNTKVNLKTGVIILYHLKNDNYTDINNKQIDYNNSNGFTLNLNFGFQQKISNKLKVDYTIGFPVYARENRPDGLTRTLVFIPNFIYNF